MRVNDYSEEFVGLYKEAQSAIEKKQSRITALEQQVAVCKEAIRDIDKMIVNTSPAFWLDTLQSIIKTTHEALSKIEQEKPI